MKLGIISDCIHYKMPDGKIATENHILLRQLQTLCSYFTETLICCPFDTYDSTKVVSTYSGKNIHFTPVPLAGGNTINAKLKLLSTLPQWWKGYKKINAFSNIVYQRFPNNLNIPGFFFFLVNRKNVFGTYTGTWRDYKSEPLTYKFQRWLLRNHFKGPVWVYSNETNSKRILPGFSPSYSTTEWDEETDQVRNRIERIRTEGIKIFRMITVGALIDYKNQLTILKACKILKKQNFPFRFSVVGDGPMYGELNSFIKSNNLNEEVRLLGKKDYAQLRELYRQNDFVVQAPLSEGFGKVPIEGFFHGVIPIINNISMASHITANGKRGFLFDATEAQNLVDVIKGIKLRIQDLPQMIEKGRAYAQTQTLEAWAENYYETVMNYFDKA